VKILGAGIGVLVAVIILAMAFSDGTHDRRQHHFQCRLGALKRFPQQYLTSDQTNNANMYVQDCMGAAGYEMQSDAAPQCAPTVSVRIWVDFCYVPMNYPAKWRQELEALFSR
jgi:hypothetical protein